MIVMMFEKMMMKKTCCIEIEQAVQNEGHESGNKMKYINRMDIIEQYKAIKQLIKRDLDHLSYDYQVMNHEIIKSIE